MADLPTLLQARYGAATETNAVGAVNPTLSTILSHKSVREFLPTPLPTGTLEILIAAGQSAATSSNLQTWSAVAVQDAQTKDKAATLCANQAFIRQAPLFFVFCADLSRLTMVSRQEQEAARGLEYTEMFLMASLDTALAAQNVAVAAESLGLGICYVGGARNNPSELAQLLGLPERVIALFGMAIGRPDPKRTAAVKPRLPRGEVLHLERWSDDGQQEHIDAYDETLAIFNTQQLRTDAPRWTQRSARRVATEKALTGRHILRQVLSERGFRLL